MPVDHVYAGEDGAYRRDALAQKPPPPAPPPPVPDERRADGYFRAGTEDYWVEARGRFNLEDKATTGYHPSPESERLRVDLDLFEGPFDLLLHLIKRDSVDIFDIPVATITERYLSVLDDMRSLDLDIAGEFLVMAATLAHIKSKMLLPKEENADDEEVDPRAELVRRLLEYQRFQIAAGQLGEMTWLGRDVFRRPEDAISVDPRDMPLLPEDPELKQIDVIQLIRLLDKMLKRSRKAVVHEVILERLNVGARINELVDFAREREMFTYLDAADRFGGRRRLNLIVTLLAILEMTRLKLLHITQPSSEEGVTGDIYVTPNHDNLAEAEDINSVDDYGAQVEDTEPEDIPPDDAVDDSPSADDDEDDNDG